MNKVFITGTDTAVGKTVVSLALMQVAAAAGICCVGYKPVAKNARQTEEGMRNGDALLLQQASALTLAYPAINPFALEGDEISTSPGCRVDYATLSQGLSALSGSAEQVVIEGTGGWRCLMNNERPLSDWVISEKLPVILVVGIKLGCINHALLTAEAILGDGLPLCGWIANRINPGLAEYASIISVLGKQLPAPLLGEIPYLPRAEQRDLTRYLDLSRLQSSLTTA
ncbi:dethiobiotin synthase [Tatumella saanichensis]|uniref:dethiobiotin synthase n=1 Tax=Tatumella saanichensis TaxID=480813 RepID=UPI0004A22D21|nr:dethiobiotin synthase [Tatumella saanichensis]